MEGQIEAMFRTEAEAEAPEQVTEPIVETPEVVEPLAQPEPEPSPEPVPEAEAPKEEQQRTIPLATFLDTRDELKETRRRLQALEAERQPVNVIDAFDDPNGFVESKLAEHRFSLSDKFARKEHGSETVDKAVEWAQARAQTDPVFAATYMRDPDPIDWIVQQHKRDSLLTDIGDSPDDWFAREAAKRGFVAMNAAPVNAGVPVNLAPKPQAPPKSIAGDASPTSSAPADPNAFWSFLDRK